MTRPTIPRPIGALAILAASFVAEACDPVPFASVEILLRQPQNIADRTRDESCT